LAGLAYFFLWVVLASILQLIIVLVNKIFGENPSTILQVFAAALAGFWACMFGARIVDRFFRASSKKFIFYLFVFLLALLLVANLS
jgi:hypothetical protein